MTISTRYNMTADVVTVAEASDGHGGLIDVPTTLHAAMQFFRWKPKPFTVESTITRLGLEPLAALYFVETEDPRAVDIPNNSILKVSSSVEYRVYSVEPVFGANGTPYHWTLTVVLKRYIV